MFPTRWLREKTRTPNTARRPVARPRFRPRLEALGDRTLPSGGVLDPTFDGDGVVTTNL